MKESHPPSDPSKWKRHYRYKSLRSFKSTNINTPDVQPSKWARRPSKPIDPLKPNQDNIISKRSKKQLSGPISDVRLSDGTLKSKKGKGGGSRYNVAQKIILNNNSLFEDGGSELGQTIVSTLRARKGGSSGLRSDSSSGGSGGSNNSSNGGGSSSGGSSNGSSGGGDSGSSSGGSSSGGSIFSLSHWASYIWSSADPLNEAMFHSKLTVADYSRLNKKIGAIARPSTVNLCYLNAGIQALAATRFVHFVDRIDQITPISGGGHGLLQITENIANAFRSVNKWYNAGFYGSLSNRVAAGRVHQTPVPDTIGMGKLPFMDTASGTTPMCDIMEFLDSIIGSLNEEYLREQQTFHNWGASGWVNFDNPTTCMQATKVSCLICGYTYVEETSRVWVGALYKPHTDHNVDGSHTVNVAHTLDHFTRVALVENEACISCNLVDLYKIYRRTRRHLRTSAKGEADVTSAASKKIASDSLEIARRMLTIEQGLRRKLKNEKILVDENGRLRGIRMRSEALTPRSPRSETQAISRLPNTIILGYNIVQSDTLKKNRTQLNIPPILSFAPWTADATDGNHNRNPLRPLRPSDSKFNDGIEFECRAISYHHGETTNSGHYFTDRLPWIPSPKDIAAGADPRQPYEWWFCNEYLTDMFTADQPFPRPSGAKEQEVLVVYERIMDPADKAAIILPSADNTVVFDYNREYQFSEYSIPAGGPVVFKNEQKLPGTTSPRLDLSRWTNITGFFFGVRTRPSKRVRVDDYEDEDLLISPVVETRPSKRARVVENGVGGLGIRSTRGIESKVDRERRKAMENLHDSSLIRHPKVLADSEQKKKWRMGGSHGGNFILPPSSESSPPAPSRDSSNGDEKGQRMNSSREQLGNQNSSPSANSITPIYIVHEDEPEVSYETERVDKLGPSNHTISEKAKGKRLVYQY
ncbi:hypothetical protein TWF506_010316 [Arthrobotrys conoides]|uniref:Peptidase C19 ubiquitin carboxyl-terminal hydrolase domain-containing protein n=1 Tax=Arthrobotrys conoides TaxID=74498 RepID=A0AAN8RKT7_9PEZI